MSQANGTQSPVKTSQEAASTSEAPPEQALVPAQTQTDAPEQNESKFAALFNQLGMQQQDPSSSRDQPKSRYAFWQTQPVPQFGAEAQAGAADGPLDKEKSVSDVRQTPYDLPEGFEWSQCDISDSTTVQEVFKLLTFNYVEDDDEMFRFRYTPEFLRWALQPPGFQEQWHIGVRAAKSRLLVGFITGVPARVNVNGHKLRVAEINFLCVHKKLRSKRLAPLLIKEVTRRVNLQGMWQAAYTAGVVLPKPVATCQYWHRSLNPKKLISINFSRLAPRMTMARTIKLYKLPDEPLTPGLRPLVRTDVPQVTKLLQRYLGKFKLAPEFSEDEVEHYLMPVEDVICSYVVEAKGGELTDMLSFYTLPSTVLGNDKYDTLKAAFQYYTVPGKTDVHQLMNDALILAHARGHDVFNALDIFENGSFLKDLKFGVGDGLLRYYLYNWATSANAQAADVGLVLL